jgi:hypothetical protein
VAVNDGVYYGGKVTASVVDIGGNLPLVSSMANLPPVTLISVVIFHQCH